jgi:serine protease Do
LPDSTIFALLFISAFIPCVSADPANGSSRRITPIVEAAATLLPSVVNISTERIVEQRYRQLNPHARFFGEYFGPVQRREVPIPNSLGSGVIVDQRGLIVTNQHVIRRASRILITLSSGENYDAKPIAFDEVNDLALLMIEDLPEDKKLTPVNFAVPDDLLLGETVVTVGNPFGLGHSVASGILSARQRRFTHNDQVLFEDILQTDAAINPGNSGGPLVNADGQLIGINVAMRVEAENIGFAIPVKRVERLLTDWLIPSRFSVTSCGLIPETKLNERRQPYVVVGNLLADSPAAASGLKVGDRISQVNGKPVKMAIDVSRMIWGMTPADTLRVKTADGREVAVKLKPIPLLSGEELARQKLDVQLQQLTPRLANAMGLAYTRGLVISHIGEDSTLAKRGIVIGDVIIQIGNVPVSSFTDVFRALNSVRHGDIISLVIDRIVEINNDKRLYRYIVEVPF